LQRCDKPDPHYTFAAIDVMRLFQFIAEKSRMQPWTYSPFTAFFLLSLDCFEFYSENWPAPQLKTLDYPVCF
jgi:hypothetical protein